MGSAPSGMAAFSRDRNAMETNFIGVFTEVRMYSRLG
jgi:hypothetical protein